MYQINNIVTITLIILITACTAKEKPVVIQNSNNELDLRIEKAYNRVMFGENPKMDENFLLACLTLDKNYERRFTNFSGDQPGRYLSIMSVSDIKNNPINLNEFVDKIIGLQKADGRFGNDLLVFDPDKITGEHMALLWGNGRLFAGLLDYYGKYKYDKALQSAQKLGDFLAGVTTSCTTPENIEMLKSMGAMGFICFTQNIEGLVKLYRFTSDKKYLNLAETIYPLLPERGTQHSHGFLNTIRGVLMLYNETKKEEQLAFVAERYEDVVNSADYQITGGVPEFFGGFVPREGYRNEGCSEVDFLMLSLALWHSTGDGKYLDKAEYCLMNELFYNQYNSGDFGSHLIDTVVGFRTSAMEDRAWWCCTYHGIMGMVDAKNNIVTRENNSLKINLYFHNHYSDDDISISIENGASKSGSYNVVITASTGKVTGIELRKPYWAKKATVKVNNKTVDAVEKNGYLQLQQQWKKNDVISLDFEYNTLIRTKKGEVYSRETLPPNPIKGAIIHGPYLMAANDYNNWQFMSEPSWNNIIYVEPDFVPGIKSETGPATTQNGVPEDATLSFIYKHEGDYKLDTVTLRPISMNTFQHPANVQVWFNFQKK
jgi:DUF1680 family protein